MPLQTLTWENEKMGKSKTKAIQANLGIFTHIQAYSDRYMQT